MKTFPTLCCIGLICIASTAIADVHVPPGDLGDAVESLARQTRVNVLYPGALLDGRKTAGVAGPLSPTEAFGKLLEGSPLVVTEERGALRIANAADSNPSERQASAAQVPASAVTSGAWTSHELHLACANCNFEIAMKKLLEELGATGVTARPQHWSFQSLSAVEGAGTDAAQPLVAAHWRTVTIGREGRWRRDDGFNVAAVLYDNLRTDILPLFATRNLSERDGRITVDVLAVDSAPAGTGMAGTECHRVAQGNRIQRYCGSPAQWKELAGRVGFACRSEGKRDELCASASQWKRMDLAAATRRSLDNRRTDDGAEAAARNQPQGVQPTVPAPASTPPPAPPPPPAAP